MIEDHADIYMTCTNCGKTVLQVTVTRDIESCSNTSSSPCECVSSPVFDFVSDGFDRPGKKNKKWYSKFQKKEKRK